MPSRFPKPHFSLHRALVPFHIRDAPRELPADLRRRVRQRLSTSALLLAVLLLAATLGGLALIWWRGVVPQRDVGVYVVGMALCIVAFLGLAALGRGALSDGLVLGTARVLGVALCCWLTFLYEHHAYGLMGVWPDATAAMPLLVLFPVLVPGGLYSTLATALGLWLSAPLGLWIAARLHGASPGFFDYANLSAAYAVAAAAGAYGSAVVHGLTQAVAQARELGSYSLEEVLGRGGMGEVWRASHRMLRRPAAVKLVKSDLLAGLSSEDRKQLLQRFSREANATAELASPHTVRLYDYGQTDDGTIYYVMELLQGMDLETLVRRHGPLPPERAVALLIQVCHSLREAHQAGLVHRDIKPANIMLCPRLGGDADVVKVLDFGLVVLNSAAVEEQERLTQQGRITGTPAYMAPEMMSAPLEVNSQADLYALGCVATWLLCGRVLFPGKQGLAALSAHLTETPLPLGERVPGGLPPELEEIVHRCLAKDPAERPAGAGALMDALQETGLAAGWTAARCASWWEAHPEESDVGEGSAAPAAGETWRFD